jgi:hypothetical protein
VFKTMICCVAAAAMLSIAGVSTAQVESDEDSPRVIYKERTEIEFDTRALDAVILKPDGTIVRVQREAVFNPLVKLRLDFNPEMLQSVQQF